MKNRHGFVSNSSSSSFVVIGMTPIVRLEVDDPHDYQLGSEGECEFGWGPSDIHDVYSRLNFALLQAMLSEKQGISFAMEMFRDSISEHTNIKEFTNVLTLGWNEHSEKRHGYIDHQSSCPNNMEIFDSRTMLDAFLFSPDSVIHLDNDNH
jgi:hypothetical protein